MKPLAFVLRTINGRFDACLAGAGTVRAAWRRVSVAPSMAFAALSRLLLLPLAMLAIAALALLAMLHQPHLAAHGPVSALGGAGLMGITAAEKAHDDIQATLKQFRETLDASQDEKKKFGEERAETKSMIERMQKALDTLEVKMQRALTGGRSADDVETKRTERDEQETKAFTKYIRKGDETELKSLSTDSDPDGGYAAPNALSTRIINKLIQFSNVRALATIEPIAKGSGLDVPAEGAQNFDAGWVGQRQSRSETTAGQLRMEKIPAHEMYAKPLISQTQLDDEMFDLESWAGDRVARRLGVIEGAAFVNGSGVGEPEGFMQNANVASVVSGSAAAITTDGMFDLMAALPTPYALMATIVANRKTKYALRKLKDSQNRYLWEPSLVAGTPAAFDATPFVELIDMPDIAANAYPVAYGDFKSAYTIVDRQGIRIMRDPYSSKPFIELYTTKRTGGQVVLAEALLTLKCST